MTHIDSAAQRKIGIEGWEPCVFEAVTGGMLLTGGIPKIVNGKKKWPARKLLERIHSDRGRCFSGRGPLRVRNRQLSRLLWHWSTEYRMERC